MQIPFNPHHVNSPAAIAPSVISQMMHLQMSAFVFHMMNKSTYITYAEKDEWATHLFWPGRECTLGKANKQEPLLSERAKANRKCWEGNRLLVLRADRDCTCLGDWRLVRPRVRMLPLLSNNSDSGYTAVLRKVKPTEKSSVVRGRVPTSFCYLLGSRGKPGDREWFEKTLNQRNQAAATPSKAGCAPIQGKANRDPESTYYPTSESCALLSGTNVLYGFQ